MNFKDQIQQIFGTTDIHELKQISRDADNYRGLNADMNNSSIPEKKKNTGRKKFVYRRTAGTYFGTAGPGRKNYRYCQTVSCFPPDDLQSDKASL